MKVGFEQEVDRWIEEGILKPWNEKVEFGVIPLMAVKQPTKNKIRPVLDFRELNSYIRCHTGDNITDVCNESLRDWRRENSAMIVDLKAAYLQIHVSKELWQYQLVNYKGQTYCLTRLGFGLNSAPRIMSKILKTVLGKSEKIRAATKSYIDDILVDEHKVSAGDLISHLNDNGLVTKSPEPLDGGAALGLQLKRNAMGEMGFSRGNEVPENVTGITKRELFSVCGKLTGHYPVAGWLRIACSYIKRMASSVNWEDGVDRRVVDMLNEMLCRVKEDDPVRGMWYVPRIKSGTVWCDASSIGLGVVLEIGGNVVEDAAWLRKKSDFNHINVSELEAVMKGVNLAIKWDITDITIVTDSATVYGWVKTILSEERRVQTKGAAELLVKRRLGILKDLITEYGLDLTIELVSTTKNKADHLTRVKKSWLNVTDSDSFIAKNIATCAAVCYPDVKHLHEKHHMGIDRTLYLARKVFPDVNRGLVKRVVQECEQCQSIDPSPESHEKGGLGVADNWTRLAVDITHFHQIPYLSAVDCGPGRFTIWKRLKRETADFIVETLDEMFLERGPVKELLMDNGLVFHSEQMQRLVDKWRIKTLYRAAYRASGNGIVERNHRTIKSVAEKAQISPLQAVFWYNSTPRNGIDPETVPHRAVYQYEWNENSVEHQEGPSSRYQIGDDVWVKPPTARCTTKWKKGTVTGINSNNNVDVDGTARHVLDIRRVVMPDEEPDEVGGENSVGGERNESGSTDCSVPRSSHRERHQPVWAADYIFS